MKFAEYRGYLITQDEESIRIKTGSKINYRDSFELKPPDDYPPSRLKEIIDRRITEKQSDNIEKT